jgi:hypothetical protein
MSEYIVDVIQVEDRFMAVADEYRRPRTTPQRSDAQAYDKTTPPVPTWLDRAVLWAAWGDDDRMPTRMREKIEAVPVAGAVLDKKIRFLQGTRLVYFKNADIAKGAEAMPAYMPQVEAFLKENRIETEWFPAQCADYCLPYNAFSEFILSNDRSKITNLYHIGAEHARLSRASQRGTIDYVIYSYHFPFGTAVQDQYRRAIPLYRWYDREVFFKELRGAKFAWHTGFPTPGKIYYSRPWHLGLFKEDGWMDVSADVPKIVRAMQKNQVRIKYTIAIPETYFRMRHSDWDTMDNGKRQAIFDAKVSELNESLTGTSNVYKSVSYVFKENEITGAALGLIRIESVDDKIKEGTWVPDSFAADQQIVQGLGMDPSQIGLSPQSGKMGAGSGSDKRESFNILIDLNTPEQRQILEPLNFVADFNKWGVTFLVDHNSHTTTNNQESGIVPSPNSPNTTK